jgi:hypothetical protein
MNNYNVFGNSPQQIYLRQYNRSRSNSPPKNRQQQQQQQHYIKSPEDVRIEKPNLNGLPKLGTVLPHIPKNEIGKSSNHYSFPPHLLPTLHRELLKDTNTNTNTELKTLDINKISSKEDKSSEIKFSPSYFKGALFGIKKTPHSDFNFANVSSNSSDFKICLNNKKLEIYDCFYLSPNILEINSKTDTNIINEKKVEIFKNKTDINDIHYFPIDYSPTGILLPLKEHSNKIIIKNIYWNIFQSIKNDKFDNNEILCVIPERTEYINAHVKLQINFEVHTNVSKKIEDKYGDVILPYKNIVRGQKKDSVINPSLTCVQTVQSFKIENLSGSNNNNFEFNIPSEFNLSSVLLCVKISVPNEVVPIMKGYDKSRNDYYGSIPFSQFILNFDYEVDYMEYI